MPRLTRPLAAAALAAALVAAPLTVSAASAATYGHGNVLRGYCDRLTVAVSCVESTDDGLLHVRNSRGRVVTLGSDGYSVRRNSAILWRYLTRYSHACRHEDSPSCYWIADRRGNGEGASFLAVGWRGVIPIG